MILKSPFTINKSAEIVQCCKVRTDSNEREKERGHNMAKAAVKTKAKAKKKPMKRTVAKKRATKRR